jgi:hypothetical protein
MVDKPERTWPDDLQLTLHAKRSDEMVLHSLATRIQVGGWPWTAWDQTKESGPSAEALEIQDPHDFRMNVARSAELLI